MAGLREAVARALGTYGPELLGAPQRFVGAVADSADASLPGATVLASCCDARLLEPFASAVGSRDAAALERACALAEARLVGDYAIDAVTARGVATQLALGVCDFLQIVPPPALLQSQGAAGAASMAYDDLPVGAGSLTAPMPQQHVRGGGEGWSQGAIPGQIPQPQPEQGNGRMIAAIAVGIAAALVTIVAVLLLVPGLLGGRGAAGQRYRILASVTAAGLDADGSRIPVHVEGTTSEGEALSEDSYIDYLGYGLELPAGSYTVTVVSSPISGGGDLYDYQGVNATQVDIPVGGGGLPPVGDDPGDGNGTDDGGTDDGGTGDENSDDQAVRLIDIVLSVLPPDQVTADMLRQARQYVIDDPTLSASLKEGLVQRIDSRIAELEAAAAPDPTPAPDPAPDPVPDPVPVPGPDPVPDPEPTQEQQVISALNGYYLRLGDIPESATTVYQIQDGVVTITSSDGSVETMYINSAQYLEGNSDLFLDGGYWYFPDIGRAAPGDFMETGDLYLTGHNPETGHTQQSGMWKPAYALPDWFTG